MQSESSCLLATKLILSNNQQQRKYILKIYLLNKFLAPTGAQVFTMFVCLVQVCPELSIFIFLTKISQQSFNSHLISHHTVGAFNTSSCYCIFKTKCLRRHESFQIINIPLPFKHFLFGIDSNSLLDSLQNLLDSFFPQGIQENRAVKHEKFSCLPHYLLKYYRVVMVLVSMPSFLMHTLTCLWSKIRWKWSKYKKITTTTRRKMPDSKGESRLYIEDLLS